jgi:hypothetical protein
MEVFDTIPPHLKCMCSVPAFSVCDHLFPQVHKSQTLRDEASHNFIQSVQHASRRSYPEYGTREGLQSLSTNNSN